MSATSRPQCAFAQSGEDVDVDCHAPADVVVEPAPATAPGAVETPICLAHLAYIRSESGVTCWRELERLDAPGQRGRTDA